MADELILFQENGLYGARNQAGAIIINPQYIEMHPFSCGLAMVRDKGFKYSFVKPTGETIIPFGKYDWVDPSFVFGVARVVRNEMWGIIDIHGKEILPLAYERIWPLNPHFINRIKLIKDGEECFISLYDIVDKTALDGLIWLKSFSIEEAKKTFKVDRIDVKMNHKTGEIYSYLLSSKMPLAMDKNGRLGIPQHPVISFVYNVHGSILPILHEAEDTGKDTLYRMMAEPDPKQEQVYYDKPEPYRDDDQDWAAYIEDAFEGDMDNYWNID